MKEFIEKLIERLKEKGTWHSSICNDDIYSSFQKITVGEAIEIVSQLAEEYKPCNKPSCKDCEVYDTEKHYCPKWCDVIKHTTEELAEEYNNGWIPCSERLPEEDVLEDGYVEPSEAVLVFTKYNSYKVSRYWGNRRNKRDYHDWVDIKYRKNEVIAWKHIAPYQPKGE